MKYLEWYANHPWLGSLILLVASELVLKTFCALVGVFK